jgi:iron complex outermembrane receptor protein
MMGTAKTLRTVRLVVLCTTALSGAAMAQQAETAAAAESGIEEIVVTAQRVTQNLQDVPLAVTAVSGAALQNANITDATRLELVTPGLTIGRSGTDLRPAIRGVRTENVGANADPTVGFFIDGVYQSRPSQAMAGFVDMSRVEVLRGPQGTLFGRNTYGGAISLVTNAPTADLGGAFNVMYGRFDRIRADGHVNLPASEVVQFRLAAMWEQADGYVNNIGPGNDLGDEDQFFIRPSVRIAPSDGFELIVRGAYWKQEGAGLAAFGFKSKGTLVDPALVSATNSGRSLGGRPIAINTRLRDGVADLNGFDIGVPILDPYTINFDATSVRDNEMKSLTAEANIELGDYTLRSITGYVDWYSFRSTDNDFSPFPIAEDANLTDSDTFSQEFQLISPRGQTFEWIVGGYYFNDDIVETFFNDQNNAFPAAGSPAAAGPPFQAGTPTAGPFALVRADFMTPVEVRTKSYAGFAQGTFNLSDQFAVTAGIRYTEDKKRYTRRLISVPGVTLANIATAPPTAQANQRATFDKVTWRVAAEYKPSDDNLLYGSVSTGFTSGGFNGGTFTAGGVTQALPPFDPQTITAYEVGSKNRFLDGMLQLNASLFYNDLKGLQVQTQLPVAGTTTVLSVTGNSGKARAYGGEVEAILRPTDAFTLGFNASILNAEYKTLFLNNPFPNPVLACPAGAAIGLPVGTLRCVTQTNGASVAQVDLGGARIPYSPKFTSNIYAMYDIETSVGTFTPQLNFFYNSGFFNTDFNTALDKQGSYTKTDLRLSWSSLDEMLSAQIFVENLEDEAVNQRGVFGANQSLNANWAPPRTYGVKVGVRF